MVGITMTYVTVAHGSLELAFSYDQPESKESQEETVARITKHHPKQEREADDDERSWKRRQVNIIISLYIVGRAVLY